MLAKNLARNLSQLRKQRGLTQQQLASRAQIPRSTVTHMESGAGNPSLNNLVRVAEAIGVSIEELLARPRGECQLIRAADVPVRERSNGEIRIHELLPERVRGLEIIRLELDPGATMVGTPHLDGTKEYLYGLRGNLCVLVAGQLHETGPGDVFAFPGDQTHSYLNRSRNPAEAVSVVVPVSQAL